MGIISVWPPEKRKRKGCYDGREGKVQQQVKSPGVLSHICNIYIYIYIYIYDIDICLCSCVVTVGWGREKGIRTTAGKRRNRDRTKCLLLAMTKMSLCILVCLKKGVKMSDLFKARALI